jgi:hypothetical protein
MSVDILWKGNPITTMKTYGTNHCALCMKERAAILNPNPNPNLGIFQTEIGTMQCEQ